jgi:hypothetical protein
VKSEEVCEEENLRQKQDAFAVASLRAHDMWTRGTTACFIFVFVFGGLLQASCKQLPECRISTAVGEFWPRLRLLVLPEVKPEESCRACSSVALPTAFPCVVSAPCCVHLTKQRTSTLRRMPTALA